MDKALKAFLGCMVAVAVGILIGVICGAVGYNTAATQNVTYNAPLPLFSRDRFDFYYIGNTDCVVVDTMTNVTYLYLRNGNGAAVTVLVDAEGKPLLYENLVSEGEKTL